jgi:hypothetical protein
MRTTSSIDDFDEQLLRKWCAHYHVKTVLEFGPGYSTEVFTSVCGHVDSVEDNEQHLGDGASANKCIYHPFTGRCANIPDLLPKYDLGFVDGPAGAARPLARLSSALFCADRCRLIALHDTGRSDEKFIVEIMERMGWTTVQRRLDGRGMVLMQLRPTAMEH